jgi:molecular chaperone GrpE
MEEKKIDFEENEITPIKEMTEEVFNNDDNPNEISELEKVKSELQEQKDKFLRLSAEFDNYKRRSAKERIELMQTAGKEIIVSLLDVIDDSERAEKQLKLSNEKNENIEGTLLVFNKLKNILQQKGLTPMESINTDFDVEKHEAIAEFEAPEDKKGKVIDEMVKGYYLNEKIIRFAKVVVGK